MNSLKLMTNIGYFRIEPLVNPICLQARVLGCGQVLAFITLRSQPSIDQSGLRELWPADVSQPAGIKLSPSHYYIDISYVYDRRLDLGNEFDLRTICYGIAMVNVPGRSKGCVTCRKRKIKVSGRNPNHPGTLPSNALYSAMNHIQHAHSA
jgi:hypothetical protein